MSTTPPNGGEGWSAAPPPPAFNAPQPLRPDEEKTWAILGHLLPFVFSFLAPLVIWLVFKGRGAYLEHQAKESLNFQLTLLIVYIVGSILLLVVVGIVILIAAGIGALVLQIMAAVAASKFEWYRYPVSIRFIK
ncbi:MAG: DUF4870 domain-containing protein [Cellulomonas sp.]|uniref:Membrane protein n=1 Tax=Cellulomonas gelida TaxID=1712 RepID=A0A4Y3KIR5_9CELL|nr:MULTISPECIES: DUF4870 domain-containing protein [Cellulomonas]KMM45461.1 hypothetical protein CWIS_10595 [Cellulomonas sp. A375-1]MCR6647891.1 DUF4870 domain-containing protein [Cellulomonas sp.]GEA83872.1 membrane protein [Cellulomonas gelida]GGL25442.1 membrane protein [Cellulomonas gelida]